MKKDEMQYVPLNISVEMSMLDFGVFQIPDEEPCEKSVCNAIEADYRLIDSATAYENEEAVGKVIKRSGVPREELCMNTKLWRRVRGELQCLMD